MKELSLNILDIAMNSVKAGAKNIEISIDESKETLIVIIKDDGCGMTPEQVKSLTDPFFTTRTTRKVGLGVPFYKLAAEQTGGSLTVESISENNDPVNHGTVVKALFNKNSIDYTPLGDIITTIVTLIQGNPHIDFLFEHNINNDKNVIVMLSTVKIREILGNEVPLHSFEVLDWIRDYLNEQYN